MASFTQSNGDDIESGFEILDDMNISTSTTATEASNEKKDEVTSTNSFPWQSLFEKHGIGEFADKVGAAIGAKTLDDLRMLNEESMIIEAAQHMGMMMIPTAKLRAALKELSSKDAECNCEPESRVASTKAENAAVACTQENSSSHPAECVVVCIDRSYSMGSPFNEQAAWGEDAARQRSAYGGQYAQRTRMDAVKQVFYAFRDRTETVSNDISQHKIGLLSFDDKIERHLGLTSSFDTFEEIIDDIEKRGSTSIYSAISEAVDMLRPVFVAHPETDLRILCLTDGENNAGISPEAAMEQVNSIGAVVDAIIVGDCPDNNLRKIVSGAEGQCFQIKSLSEGFQLMEGEGVVSLKARRGGAEKPKFVQRQKVNFANLNVKQITRGAAASASTTVKRKVTGKVMALDSTSIKTKYATQPVSTSSHLKRIMKELKQVAEGDEKVWYHSGEGVHIFPDESDMTKMRVLIQGPVGSPFEGGTFLLNVFVPSGYPFKPPSISFETPIYHCNVSESGRICIHLLQSGWVPSCSIPKALECIRTLMAKPDTDEALRQWIAEEVLANRQHGEDTADGRRYLDNAKAQTMAEASRTVDGWKAHWNLSNK